MTASAQPGTGTATTITMTIPAGAQVGDVAHVVISYALTTTPTTPTGWNVYTARFTGATTTSEITYEHVVASGEPGVATFSVTLSTATRWAAVMGIYTGVDATTQQDTASPAGAGTTTAATTSPGSPSITPTTSASGLIVGAAARTSANGVIHSFTAPSGMSLVVQASSANVTTAPNTGAAEAFLAVTGTGAQSGYTWTDTQSSGWGVSSDLLRAAAAGAAAVRLRTLTGVGT